MANAPAVAAALAHFDWHGTLKHLEIGRDGLDEPCPPTIGELMRVVGKVRSLKSLILTAHIQGTTLVAQIFHDVVQCLVSDFSCHSLQSIHLSITGNGDLVASAEEIPMCSPWQLFRIGTLESLFLRAHISVMDSPHAQVLGSALGHRQLVLRKKRAAKLRKLGLDLQAETGDTRFLAWETCLASMLSHLSHPLGTEVLTSFSFTTNISLVRRAGLGWFTVLGETHQLEHLTLCSHRPFDLTVEPSEQPNAVWVAKALNSLPASAQGTLRSLRLAAAPLGYVCSATIVCLLSLSLSLSSSLPARPPTPSPPPLFAPLGAPRAA